MSNPKDMLHGYLRSSRQALLWKLDGLGERELRWPHTPTGTNLLGLVKHVASIELGYFGEVFGRPSPVPLPWMADDTEDNADMWATADESVDWVVDLYHRAWEHADATIAALDLEATGEVSWWRPGARVVTLHRILVHVIAETARHAGHADIIRELADGKVGLRDGMTNIPAQDAQWWADYVARLRQVADADRG